MSKVRDQQRQKIYQAEKESLHKAGKEFKNLKEVEIYIKRICKSHYWKKQGGASHIEVRDGRGRRSACAWNTHIISIPRWARQEVIILHELAHTLVNFNEDNIAWHGREFAKCLLGLVKRFMGIENYNLLKVAYKKYHIHYSVKKKEKGLYKIAT